MISGVSSSSIISQDTANNFTVVWRDCIIPDFFLDDRVISSCYVDIQNLNSSSAREFNLQLLFSNTSYEIEKTHAEISEWKAIPTNFTTYNNRTINQTCITPELISYDCSYNETYQNGTITKSLAQFKSTKANLFNDFGKLKANFGLINIPKFNSNAKYDDFGNVETQNGTKTFLVEWSTPFSRTSASWGSSGKIAFIDLLSGEEYHPWWNISWQYQQEYNFTSALALENYQIRIDINSSMTGANWNWTNLGKDIFITNSSNSSQNFWIENWTYSATAGYVNKTLIWVNASNLISGTNTFYVFYGNPDASSQSKIDDVFLFSDSFDDASRNTTKWNFTGVEPVLQNSTLLMLNSGDRVYTNRSFSPYNLSLRTRLTFPSNYYQTGIVLLWGDFSANEGLFVEGGATSSSYFTRNATNYTSVNFDTTTAWHTYEIQWKNNFSRLFYDDGFVMNQTNSTPNVNIVVAMRGLFYVDYIFLKKFASPEPVMSSWGQQNSYGAVSTPSINLSLVSPLNNTYSNTRNTNFTYVPSTNNANNISNSSLWTNISGTFALTQYNETGISNGSLNGINSSLSSYEGSLIWNIRACAGSTCNFSEFNRTLIVDTIKPAISITGIVNNQYFNSKLISINGTSTDTYLNFTNITIYNFSGTLINSTINYSVIGLLLGVQVDGNYTINITAYDNATNYNSTTINITIDSTLPQIEFISPTEANNTYFSRNFIAVNVSVTETNEDNITFYLFNSSTMLNSTNLSAGTRGINFTNLNSNMVYFYNVTVRDLAGNTNTSETRTITLDTTPPEISNSSLESTAINTNESVILNATVIDTTTVDTVKFYIQTPYGNYNISAINNGSNFYITCNATAQCATNITGQYNWTSIWANDSSGNANSTSISLQFNVSNPRVYTGSMGFGGSDSGTSTPESVPQNITRTPGILPFVITPRHLDDEGKDNPAMAILNSSDIAIYQIIFGTLTPMRIWVEGNEYDLSSGYKINSKDMVIISPEGTLDVKNCPKFDLNSGLCIWGFQIVSNLPPDATGVYFADVWVISGNYQEKIQVELRGTKQYQYSDWVGYFNIPLWSGVVLGRDITLYSWMFLPMLVLVLVAHRVWQYMKVLAYKRRFGARDKAEKLHRATKT